MLPLAETAEARALPQGERRVVHGLGNDGAADENG
jgi:hypothetical protein